MPRSSITVTFCGRRYTGEYEIRNGSVHVFFGENLTVGQMSGSDPQLSARLLLIELLSKVVRTSGQRG
jgi:hypothetical protein